jgi:hypothetical protein
MAAEMSEQLMVRLAPELLDQLKAISQEQERTIVQTVRLRSMSFPRFSGRVG